MSGSDAAANAASKSDSRNGRSVRSLPSSVGWRSNVIGFVSRSSTLPPRWLALKSLQVSFANFAHMAAGHAPLSSLTSPDARVPKGAALRGARDIDDESRAQRRDGNVAADSP